MMTSPPRSRSSRSPTTDRSALKNTRKAVSDRVVRIASIDRRVAIRPLDGLNRAPSSNIVATCRTGSLIAGEPNQVLPASVANAAFSGGLDRTPISTSSPICAPVGSSAELPMKLRRPIFVCASSMVPCPILAAPKITESAMKLSGPISTRSGTMALAVEISARRPTFTPSARYQGIT